MRDATVRYSEKVRSSVVKVPQVNETVTQEIYLHGSKWSKPRSDTDKIPKRFGALCKSKYWYTPGSPEMSGQCGVSRDVEDGSTSSDMTCSVMK
ncbi:hypothetical protein RUM44_007937 [Polyplax serrata]|uniref:Uncharacterized protein n=1 Tax=Polyplax serrata TaxID=468196 RepID=A0ABR1B8Z0_POLSC